MWFRSLGLFGLLTAFLASPLLAQFPGTDPPPATPEPTVEKFDELVFQLESQARRGGLDLAKAVASLTRVGAVPEAIRRLEEIGKSDDVDLLAESAKAIGPAMMLRLSLSESLSESGQTSITKMSDALKRYDQSVERLRAAIEDLGTDSVDKNLAANRTLLRGGDVAIGELVAAVGRELPRSHRAKVIQVLRSFDREAIDAVGELALYGTESVRANALDAFQQLASSERSTVWSIGAMFAINATDQERSIAAEIASVSSRDEAIGFLVDRLNLARRVAHQSPNDDTPATVWSIDPNGTAVVPTRSEELYLQYRRSYDLAQQLRRLGTLPSPALNAAISADLAYRVMSDLDWGDPEQLEEFKGLYGPMLDTDQLLIALNENRHLGYVPSALGLIRVLGSDATPRLLHGSVGKISPLVDAATRDATPRIRYEAASLIASILQTSDIQYYAGSSEVKRTLAEMVALTDHASAVLLETRPAVAVGQESILGQLGLETRIAMTASDVEREVARGGDLRMILSKIEISDASAIELVDRVRRRPAAEWSRSYSSAMIRQTQTPSTPSNRKPRRTVGSANDRPPFTWWHCQGGRLRLPT